MAIDRIPDFSAEAGERAAQVIQIDSGKHVAVVAVCAIICGMSAVYAWSATRRAEAAEKRADLLQYYVMELDGKLMSSGIIRPNESWSARQASKENP